ncbi:MAG: L-fucokinase [Acidobacteriota bacterium]|nr:L-fucokinase [Acidobacteriota bacterium]
MPTVPVRNRQGKHIRGGGLESGGAGWDYLIVTASNEDQASAARRQLELRQDLGLLGRVSRIEVVPDPGGRRIGSGGSTILCLLRILERECGGSRMPESRWRCVFERLRILIVHAGGDSKRLPPYGPCGKLFIPVPGGDDRVLPHTLFDRQLANYLSIPAPVNRRGHVVVVTGDVFLSFDPAAVRFDGDGITDIGCPADPGLASHHGVYVPGKNGWVRAFFQKPSPEKLRRAGVLDARGRAVMDIGVKSISPPAAVELLRLAGARAKESSEKNINYVRGPEFSRWVEKFGFDLYRDVSCAQGTGVSFDAYLAEVREAGSKIPVPILRRIFGRMSRIPFHVRVVPRCRFLHFGTLRELVSSGRKMLGRDGDPSAAGACLSIDNDIRDGGSISGRDSLVEGCLIAAPLRLKGGNIVAGADISRPATLPARTVLDLLPGRNRQGRPVRFFRFYGIDDRFHQPDGQGAHYLNRPFSDWLKAMEARDSDIWDATVPVKERSLWNARLFPALKTAVEAESWMWVFGESPDPLQKRRWREADRYSFEEMARLADHAEFHDRRIRHRLRRIRGSWREILSPAGEFSARELAFLIKTTPARERPEVIAEILRLILRPDDSHRKAPVLEELNSARMIHSLGSAAVFAAREKVLTLETVSAAASCLNRDERKRWVSLGLKPAAAGSASRWGKQVRDIAFHKLGRAIVAGSGDRCEPPRNALRSDEIVWGRAPARLDLGGGWSDTPPYSLEHGGCVINAAVDLNGQPPIQAYGRLISEPEIRIHSIDHGLRLVIRDFAELLDYRSPESRFALAKAALALCGFRPEALSCRRSKKNLPALLREFGGGIELTTLAAIPSGSGLGTSSIMSAVLLSVIHRMIGRKPEKRELFHQVLQLEQELTTGGGWQDQVGGVLPGVKMITTGPGLVPKPSVQNVPAGVLDPGLNGGRTLLYYTGLRRLAKNILREVVGAYLDRDRRSIATLRDIHAFPQHLARVMAAKDIEGFGCGLNRAWELKKELDPESTTPVIEGILSAVRPYLLGAKLMGAGAGGFILMVCPTAEETASVRRVLERRPPNSLARFFDFNIDTVGLTVTVS